MDCCDAISKLFKVTADDYGYCPNRNRGIIESIEKGIVNSVSVLVNGSCVAPVVFRDKHALIGLHLNLTEGDPIISPKNISTLLQKNNKRFYPKLEFYQRISDSQVSAEEIYSEIEAQILKFKSVFQKTPDYIDGHQHVHVQPIVREMLVKCMTSYQIKQTRIPSELSMESCEWITQKRKSFNKQVICRSEDAKKFFQENSITFPPYFIGLSVMSRDLTAHKLTRALDIVKKQYLEEHNQFDAQGIDGNMIEIMTHPGYPSEKENGGCSCDGPDEFACSEDRLHEKLFLTCDSTKQLLKDAAQSMLC